MTATTAVTKKTRGTDLAVQERVIEEVLDGMRNGKTVQELAEAQGLVPSTVRKWLTATEERYLAYQQARRLQAQAMAEEAIQIARETTNHSSARDRLLIDTLKWAAAKANPAEFGDKQTVEHQGAQELRVRVVEEEVSVRTEDAVALATIAAVSAPIVDADVEVVEN